MSLLVLLFLSGFAIRSNLTTRQINQNLISRISLKPQQSSKRQRGGESDEVPVNFEMVEMLHTGRVPPDVIDPNLRSPSPTNRQSSIDPILARRHVVEIFKVILKTERILTFDDHRFVDHDQFSPSHCSCCDDQHQLDCLDEIFPFSCR